AAPLGCCEGSPGGLSAQLQASLLRSLGLGPAGPEGHPLVVQRLHERRQLGLPRGAERLRYWQREDLLADRVNHGVLAGVDLVWVVDAVLPARLQVDLRGRGQVEEDLALDVRR